MTRKGVYFRNSYAPLIGWALFILALCLDYMFLKKRNESFYDSPTLLIISGIFFFTMGCLNYRFNKKHPIKDYSTETLLKLEAVAFPYIGIIFGIWGIIDGIYNLIK